jgi:hypothetical protein
MTLAGLVLLIVAAAPALAQQPPTAPAGSPEAGRPDTSQAQRPAAVDELEPAVNTSKASPSESSPSSDAAPAAASPSPPAGPKSASPAPGSSPARASGSAASDETTAAKAPAARSKSGKASDRIELDTTSITGNRELPKVLYIVPWKRSDLGDLTGKPVNSLLDDVLQPVDRDVFKRENRYYRAVATPGSGAGEAGVAAAPAANRDADQGHGSSAPPSK